MDPAVRVLAGLHCNISAKKLDAEILGHGQLQPGGTCFQETKTLHPISSEI